MALVKCPDCGKMISELAPACIDCGRPVKGIAILEDEKNGGSTIHYKNVTSKLSSSQITYALSWKKKIVTPLLTLAYTSIFVLIIYASDKDGQYWYLKYVSLFVIGFIAWKYISTAHRIEIRGNMIRFIRIIGTVDITTAEINSITTGAGWIQVKCGEKTISVTDLDNLDDFVSTVRSMNPQIKY